MRKDGNDVRQKIMQAIVSSLEQRGYAPSVRKLCFSTGLKSTSSVHAHLQKLQADGLIEIEMYESRAIRVPGYKFVKVVE